MKLDNYLTIMYILTKGEVLFLEKNMKKIITLSLALVFVVSCGQSEAPTENNVTFDLIGIEFYTNSYRALVEQISIKRMLMK